MSDLGQRYERIRQVYLGAIRLPGAQRQAFLAEACGDDEDLRAEVESLLAAEDASTALDTLAMRLGVREVAALLGDPERIGPYRILQRIGEGGMGVVYLAEQEQPIRRRVALKVVKPGMDSSRVLARFEAERQALAIMDHPGIAKVHDAGQTPEGRPYFVMEYVRGEPITTYCDRHCLSMRARLELFEQVCAAVQHAHHKAVIHRDLKPTNILVTAQDDRAAPKIIDFGVAKAIEHRLTERTLYTELGALVGTPEYMSPEQAEMGATDVDTRTDIYSLGVVLYELLTGALPFDPKDLRAAGYDEIRRRIREEVPSKPSTRVSTLGEASTEAARRRRVELRSLTRELRGDLDWITMRALEKDRTRRYASPSMLAADLRRHLDHEPVEAGPPTVGYRVGRFVGRHRLAVGLATTAVIAVVGFAATMAIQAARISRVNADLETVVAFQAGMLSEMDTFGVGGRLMDDLRERVRRAAAGRGLDRAELTAASSTFDDLIVGVSAPDAALRLIDEEILERSLDAARSEFGDRPEIAARLIHAIGRTYLDLGLYEAAEETTREAVEIRDRVLGEDDPATLDSRHVLAVILGNRGRFDEAEEILVPTLEARRSLLGPEDPATLESMTWLGGVYDAQRRFDEAETILTGSLEAQRRILGAEDPRTLTTASELASTLGSTGRKAEAATLQEEVFEARRRILGPEHRDTLQSLMRLALATEDRDARIAMYREATKIERESLGANHPLLVLTMANLGSEYASLGRHDEAEATLREAIEIAARTRGPSDPGALQARGTLAMLHGRKGRIDLAERGFAEVLRVESGERGPHTPMARMARSSLAWTLLKQEKYPEAEIHYAEAVEGYRATSGLEDPRALQTLSQLAYVQRKQGRLTEAIEVLEEALTYSRKVDGPTGPRTTLATRGLADAWTEAGREAEAEALLLKALEQLRAEFGPDHDETIAMQAPLANLYYRVRRYDEARPLYHAIREAAVASGDTDRDAEASYTLACLELNVGNLDEAWAWIERTLEADPGRTERLRADPELAPLRGPRFDALMARVRSKVDVER